MGMYGGSGVSRCMMGRGMQMGDEDADADTTDLRHDFGQVRTCKVGFDEMR